MGQGSPQQDGLLSQLINKMSFPIKPHMTIPSAPNHLKKPTPPPPRRSQESFLSKMADRLLTYLIMSSITLVVGLSVLTQQFPPPKKKIIELIQIGKQLIESQKNPKASIIPTNLDQMLELQRENLHKMELTQRLMALLKAIPQPPPSETIGLRLQKTSQLLQEAEAELIEAQKELAKTLPKTQ